MLLDMPRNSPLKYPQSVLKDNQQNRISVCGHQLCLLKYPHSVRFQVLTAASMMFRAVFWVVIPCKFFFLHRLKSEERAQHKSE
jgi:hypothetical protein